MGTLEELSIAMSHTPPISSDPPAAGSGAEDDKPQDRTTGEAISSLETAVTPAAVPDAETTERLDAAAEETAPYAPEENEDEEDADDEAPEPEISADRPAASLAGLRIRPSQTRGHGAKQKKPGDLSTRGTSSPGTWSPNAVMPNRKTGSPGHAGTLTTDATLRGAHGVQPLSRFVPNPLGGGTSPKTSAPASTDSASRQRRRVPGRQGSADIQGYWNRLRFGRPFPAWSDLDREQIRYFWADSVLLSCAPGQETIRKATRMSELLNLDGGDIPFNEAMVAWVLAVGREVLLEQVPVRDSERFLARGRMEMFDIIALPLAEDADNGIDHILCYVTRKGVTR